MFGGACPNSFASGEKYRKPASIAPSQSTARTRYRFESQPSFPGQRLALRQAKAFAICPATTAVKAAPDASNKGVPDGKGKPGLHPANESAARNASIPTMDSVSPSTPKALNSKNRSTRWRPCGGCASALGLEGLAPRATAGKMSVPTSKQSTCKTPSAKGKRPSERAHTTKGVNSATLSVRWYVRKRLALANVVRPCS